MSQHHEALASSRIHPHAPAAAPDLGELHAVLADLIHAYGHATVSTALTDAMPPASQPTHTAPEIARAIVALLTTQRRNQSVKVKLATLRIAIGDDTRPYSEIGYALDGLSKQRIGQYVAEWRDRLNLPPAGNMLSQNERARYAKEKQSQ